MIKKTNNNEVLTKGEAQEKYAEYYFGFVEVERNVYQPHKSKIKVLYTADTKEDWRGKRIEDGTGRGISFSQGNKAGDPTVLELGGVYIV